MSNQWSLPGWGSRNGKSEDGPMAIADDPAAEDAVAVDPIDALAAATLAASENASEESGSDAPAAEAPTADATAVDAPNPSAGSDAGQPEPEITPSTMIGEAESVTTSQDVPGEADAPALEPAIAAAATSAEAPTAEGPTAEVASPEVAAPPEDGPAFLAKLARAMHTTVARERARIDEDIERRRAAHLQAVRDRAAVDEEQIRALAADDMKSIETWAEGEMRRLKLEREQKERELNDDLDVSLKDRGARTDREIASAEAAIAAYRAQAETFFADLDREMDPVEIAQRASAHPAFPSLEASPEVGPSSDATDRSGAVGVMGVPSVGGRGLMGAMAFGSRPLPNGTPEVGGDASQGPAREPATVMARSGSQAGGSDVSPLDSLLGRRSGS